MWLILLMCKVHSDLYYVRAIYSRVGLRPDI